jgi:glycosyltransferase involved in cell wall biosynthesis
MKVSHICVNFGTPLFRELFHALGKFEIEQSVFYPRNKKNLKVKQIPEYKVDSPLVLNLLSKISFRRKRRIMQEQYDPIFRSTKPDIIHAHTLFSDGSLAYHYNKTFGTPYIVAVRASDIDVFIKYKPWLKDHARQILDRANHIIFISPSLKKKFQMKFGQRYESKSLLISNGINNSFFTNEKARHATYHTPVRLVYVGRFLKRKNVPALIRFVESYPAGLTIAGEGGNDEMKVLKMIRKSSNVNYLGRIEDTSKLRDLYRESDIFIMLSKRETLGLVYLEALSQGIPVIYSTGTGIDGLFKEKEVGIGLESESNNEIEIAIQKILSDYQSISKNCIQKAMEFNWNNISAKYYQLYIQSLL